MKSRGLRRSLTDFRRHPWLHVLSISTISVALLLLGGFFLCYRNFEQLAERTNPRITGTVYLKEALDQTQISALRERVLGLEYVQKVVFKSKTSVVEDLQVFLGGNSTETIPGSELFPDILEIELKKEATGPTIAGLKTSIGGFTEVSEVDFSEDWLLQYKKVRQFLKIFGGILMIGIVFGCSFLIANFMGMRHQSRRREIEIVRLMGAHHHFILTPFLWEGVIEGLAGTTAALSLLYVVRLFLSTAVTVQWASFLGIRTWLYLSPAQITAVVFVGMAMAFVGSITVFLRFQEKSIT